MPPRRQIDRKIFAFLDSGAYTAWKSGNPINLDEYIAYIKANEHLVDCYASLDVIPGVPTRPPTVEEVNSAAEQSYKNHQKMKRAGLHPIPVFHRGEPFKWLKRYMDEDEYIGLSPIATTPSATAERWLDECFTMLTDKEGRALRKTHGFAMTKVNLLFRYPFTTVDSTSWAMVASYGGMLIPKFKGGKPDFTQTPFTMAVSEDNLMSATSLFKQGQLVIDHVSQYIEEYVGVTLADVRNYYKGRQKVNLFFLSEVGKLVDGDKIRFRHHIRNLVN